jgi:hypothetical protein
MYPYQSPSFIPTSTNPYNTLPQPNYGNPMYTGAPMATQMPTGTMGPQFTPTTWVRADVIMKSFTFTRIIL